MPEKNLGIRSRFGGLVSHGFDGRSQFSAKLQLGREEVFDLPKLAKGIEIQKKNWQRE